MNDYQRLTRKLTGLAFILGPLLLAIGALVFLAGIGINPSGTASWVEGMFMAVGFLTLVPVYLELAHILGQRAPRLAIFCAIGALGIVFFGIAPAFLRITQAAFFESGMEQSAWHVGTAALFSHLGWMPITIWALISFISLILVGVGLLRYRQLSRWAAVLLIIAPILLFFGQGGDETIAWWRQSIFYPLATLLWLIALAPIGWRYLAGSREEIATDQGGDPAVA